MKMAVSKPIELVEYHPFYVDSSGISNEDGISLWKNYGQQINVDFPSPKSDNKWALTSQGWVGYIPLSERLHVLLQPKVELSNIFRMLEYAYNLGSFRFLDDLMKSSSLNDFYERLANILSKRVLRRRKKGYYRNYLSISDRMSCIRGRLDLNKTLQKPWRPDPYCHFEYNTQDIEDNQILAWTLYRILQSGVCTQRTLPTVKYAYRNIQGVVSLEPFKSHECIKRLYNRLNEDYRPMHSLCWFFLEHSGPTHKSGEHTFLPFLVNMERLFEKFVAEWLQLNLSKSFILRSQETVKVGAGDLIRFDIDLVIYQENTKEPICVLDTKYKIPEKIDNSDFNQVVAYAEAKGCKEAILLYPAPIRNPLDEKLGGIRIRSLAFSLDGDLENNGKRLLENIVKGYSDTCLR